MLGCVVGDDWLGPASPSLSAISPCEDDTDGLERSFVLSATSRSISPEVECLAASPYAHCSDAGSLVVEDAVRVWLWRESERCVGWGCHLWLCCCAEGWVGGEDPAVEKLIAESKLSCGVLFVEIRKRISRGRNAGRKGKSTQQSQRGPRSLSRRARGKCATDGAGRYKYARGNRRPDRADARNELGRAPWLTQSKSIL